MGLGWMGAASMGAMWAGLLVARGAPRRRRGFVWLALATMLLALEVIWFSGRNAVLAFTGSYVLFIAIGALWRNQERRNV